MSYSSYKLYNECPKRYRLRKVDKIEPPVKDSKHNAVVGSVVQRVFEDFYNLELWRKGSETSQTLLDLVPKYFYEFLDKEYVDFSDVRCNFTREECLEKCEVMVPKVLQGIKDHGLLGPYAQSEIKLRAHLMKNFFLFGYVDFIIRKSDGTVLLIDGKASKHREKYVDPDQLLFYALAFEIRHGSFPDKVGFFFFHFADDPEQAFDWIELSEERMAEMRVKLVDTFTNIQRKYFRATPSGKACKYCEFENMCEERQAELKATRQKRRWNKIEKGVEVVPETKNASASIGFGGKVVE
jgi:CRISPR/Cas system-associated exonuclease Cas4 (RecB family)